MSHSVTTISESVLAVAAMLRNGDFRTARAQWCETLTSADDREIAVLTECGRILASYPRTGVDRLREYWFRADERDRAVIAACAPRPGEQRQHPELQADRPARWDRRAIENARATRRQAGPVKRGRDLSRRRDRRQQRQAAESLSMHLAYTAANPDSDRQSQPATDRPDAYAVDYERLAINPVARDRERRDPRTTAVRDGGRPCIALGCNIEPSRTDRQYRDGLCQECRELGRPGIQLPDNATRAQAIEALCAYIHQHYPRALDHLRTEWARYTAQADRDTVAAWVAAHATKPAEHSPAPELATCHTCGEARSPRDLRRLTTDDGQCAECRALESAPASSAAPSAEASGTEAAAMAA